MSSGKTETFVCINSLTSDTHCAGCGRKAAHVWLLESTKTCAPCRGFGNWDYERMRRTFRPRTYWAVSPSQVETAALCMRKWALRNEVPYKQNIGGFRGESVHKILEAYGLRGTPPVNSRDNLVRALERRYTPELDEKGTTPDDYADRIIEVAHKMIALLPPPKWSPQRHHVEEKFKIELDGVPWKGAIDHHYSDVVSDFKVVSSADFALLKERTKPNHAERELLRDNVQALTYARRKMLRDGLDRVRLRWIYGLPGVRARAWVVEDTVTKRYVEEKFKKEITPTAKKVHRLALLHPDPMSLPPSWDACHKFGGCPFQDRCNPTAEDIASSVFREEDREAEKQEKTMGLMSNIKKSKRSDEDEEVRSKGRKKEDDEDEEETEEEEEEEVEAPRGKSSAKKSSKKADKEEDLEEARQDAEQLLDLKVKPAEVAESIAKKYKSLDEEEVEEMVNELAAAMKKSKGTSSKKSSRDEDEDEEEKPRGKSSSTSKVSDTEKAVRKVLAKVLKDVADILADE